MRARLDLDGGGEAVALDLGDDAGEAVAGAGGGDRFVAAALGEQASDLRGRDDALAARRAVDAELAVALPAAEGLDADAERLGGFADAIRCRFRSSGARLLRRGEWCVTAFVSAGRRHERDHADRHPGGAATRTPPSATPPSTARPRSRSPSRFPALCIPASKPERRTAHGFRRPSRHGGRLPGLGEPDPHAGEHEPCGEDGDPRAHACEQQVRRQERAGADRSASPSIPRRSPTWPAGMLASVAAALYAT